MRTFIAAFAMTIGSFAFQLGLQAGWFNRLTWAAPWAWGMSVSLWLWWLISHPKIEKEWLKVFHERLGKKIHLIRIIVSVSALLIVALMLRAWTREPEAKIAAVAPGVTAPVVASPAPAPNSQVSDGANQSAPVQSKQPHKPTKTESKPRSTEVPSVSTNGSSSPAVGSISQVAGSALSFGQQGGITAGTVNNYTPPERHLTQGQIADLDKLAISMPDDPQNCLIVETVNDPDAINYAGEIEKIFEARNKVKTVITRLSERPPVPKGVYVLIHDEKSERFAIAQLIATALQQSGAVQFTRQDSLTSTQVKILIGFR